MEQAEQEQPKHAHGPRGWRSHGLSPNVAARNGRNEHLTNMKRSYVASFSKSVMMGLKLPLNDWNWPLKSLGSISPRQNPIRLNVHESEKPSAATELAPRRCPSERLALADGGCQQVRQGGRVDAHPTWRSSRSASPKGSPGVTAG